MCYGKGTIAPGMAGLALAYSLNLVTNLQMSVDGVVQMEAKLCSVERIQVPAPESLATYPWGRCLGRHLPLGYVAR